MKAVVFDKYGSVENLRVEEVEKPEPQADEVRLKVHAASINSKDLRFVLGKTRIRLRSGIFRPRISIPGIDVAGTVDAMGPEAIGCKWGEEVYADLSQHGYGGFAEYVCVPKSAIALKPSNLIYEAASAVPTAATAAFQGLIDYGDMLSYRSVLIIGAAGGVGHFAIQFAKNYNLQVTAVTRPEKFEFVKSLGADQVMSYDELYTLSKSTHYELIFDTVASKRASFFRRLLTQDGRYVACAFSLSAIAQRPFGGVLNNKRVVTFDSTPSMNDLAMIRKMIEKGTVKPHIDKVFKLEEVVEAFRYYLEGRIKGKIVIHIQ
jgi:NADPH:quinone reductase-like Zn-dependent oxidoreductase